MEKDKMLYNFNQYLDEVYGKPGTPRSEAFAKYAEEGEGEMLLPDCVDNDGEIEL